MDRVHMQLFVVPLHFYTNKPHSQPTVFSSDTLISILIVAVGRYWAGESINLNSQLFPFSTWASNQIIPLISTNVQPGNSVFMSVTHRTKDSCCLQRVCPFNLFIFIIGKKDKYQSLPRGIRLLVRPVFLSISSIVPSNRILERNLRVVWSIHSAEFSVQSMPVYFLQKASMTMSSYFVKQIYSQIVQIASVIHQYLLLKYLLLLMVHAKT
jgi:hypothetical protein